MRWESIRWKVLEAAGVKTDLKDMDIYPSDNEWDFEWFIWEREIIGRIDYAYIFNFIDVL